MRAIAEYILRGRLQAIFVAASAAVMSLLLPPLSHVSGAAIGLVTLRRGMGEGLIVLAGITVLLLIVSQFSSVDFALVQAFLLAMVFLAWLPTICVAGVLRATSSLGESLSVTGVIAAIMLVLTYVVVGDVAEWWRTLLTTMLSPVLSDPDNTMAQQDMDIVINDLSAIMTGLLVATLVFTTMINLFIARWAQAKLYNPGGFGEEFLALRVNNIARLLVIPVAIVSMLASEGMGRFATELLILILALYSLQGLALVYNVVKVKQASKAWLAGLYILMLIAFPKVIMVLSIAGYTDSWMDFRSRFMGNGRSEQ